MRAQIHQAMEELKRTANITITHDWTQAENGIRSAEDSRHWSILDVDGVKAADAVVALLYEPLYHYRGTWTEVGVALGLGKPVLLYCPWLSAYPDDHPDRAKTPAGNVFFYHPGVATVTTWEAVQTWLKLAHQ